MNNKLSRKLVLIIVAFVAVAASARASLFTNAASADAFVRASAPTLNYGSAGSDSVSGGAATNSSGVANGVFDNFLRFNSSAMVASFNSAFGGTDWTINGATLRVVEQGAPANALFNRGVGQFEIRWIANDNWTEGTGTPGVPTTSGITYNDETTLLNSGSDMTLGTFNNAGVDGPLSFSLALPSAFLTDLKAGGEVGLYLTATDPNVGFSFASRNFGTASSRPVLEISAVPEPTSAALMAMGISLCVAWRKKFKDVFHSAVCLGANQFFEQVIGTVRRSITPSRPNKALAFWSAVAGGERG